MKKVFLMIFTVLLISYITTSCKKENDSAEKFSALSVEENKALVEDAGKDFVDVMGRMKTTETVDALANLAQMMSSKGAKGFLFSSDSKMLLTLEAFIGTVNGDKNIKDVFSALASPKGLSQDPESIQQFWDENVGTYTWNKTLADWDIVLGGNKFIFKFPSSDVASTNDATFTVYGYTGVIIGNPLEDDYTGDLPAALNADLKVGTKTLVTITYGASYNTDGVPKAIAADMVIESFKFEADITNDNKLVSVAYKFLEGTNVIISLSAQGKGLFTDANLQANTVTHTNTYTYTDWIWNPITQQYEPHDVTYTEEWDEVDFEEILNSANAEFRILNVALRGDVDIKGLTDQIRIIEDQWNNEVITEETALNRESAKINEFLNLRLVDVTKNQIIAKAEAYVVKEVDYYYTDYYINFRLKFSDGSPIDMETYFNSGFDNFIGALNDLIDEINSDYDLNIDPVVYK
jgi:hypothetical protein